MSDRKIQDRKIINTIWYQYRKYKWMALVLWHGRMLHDILEGRMLGRKSEDKEGY